MAENKKKENYVKEMRKLEEQIAATEQAREILLDEQKPLYTVIKWEADERVFEPKSKDWYIKLSAVAVFIVVISALTGNFGLIFAVIALILFVYALNTMPPKKVTHEITNKGIKSQGLLIPWRNIVGFWITIRGTFTLINIEYFEGFADRAAKRMILLQGNLDIKEMVRYMIQHTDYFTSKEVPNNFISRWAEGTYQPLLNYLEDETVVTKDPKDSPSKLREQQLAGADAKNSK